MRHPILEGRLGRPMPWLASKMLVGVGLRFEAGHGFMAFIWSRCSRASRYRRSPGTRRCRYVIAVRMRVDDGRDRLVGELLDLVENRLTPSGVLRIDDHDAFGRDEHCRVAPAAYEDERLSRSFPLQPLVAPADGRLRRLLRLPTARQRPRALLEQ